MRFTHTLVLRAVASAAAIMATAPFAPASPAEPFDSSRYMAPSEIRPGMKGYGRTVMSGTRIDTFQFEVISVMSNAFYAKQDVILIRCSGLRLEHSGIIGGMSGSPCYVTDEQGRERMIGAVAYGWSFNKDPICGVQPVTQMLDIINVRDPSRSGGLDRDRPQQVKAASGGSIDLGELLARDRKTDGVEHSLFDIRNSGSNHYFTINKFSDNAFNVGWYASGVDYRLKPASGAYTLVSGWNHVMFAWKK
ncbi:MAG TPA: hypothetical protein PLS23_20025, partial [Phycisphaerae bacterium]|nr:hypothetical protein [Phycisphaerae bacterium]